MQIYLSSHRYTNICFKHKLYKTDIGTNIRRFVKFSDKKRVYTEGSLFFKNQKQFSPISKFFVALREN
jgi:hypothetical protein